MSVVTEKAEGGNFSLPEESSILFSYSTYLSFTRPTVWREKEVYGKRRRGAREGSWPQQGGSCFCWMRGSLELVIVIERRGKEREGVSQCKLWGTFLSLSFFPLLPPSLPSGSSFPSLCHSLSWRFFSWTRIADALSSLLLPGIVPFFLTLGTLNFLSLSSLHVPASLPLTFPPFRSHINSVVLQHSSISVSSPSTGPSSDHHKSLTVEWPVSDQVLQIILPRVFIKCGFGTSSTDRITNSSSFPSLDSHHHILTLLPSFPGFSSATNHSYSHLPFLDSHHRQQQSFTNSPSCWWGRRRRRWNRRHLSSSGITSRLSLYHL